MGFNSGFKGLTCSVPMHACV